jgi:hypothetical protein
MKYLIYILLFIIFLCACSNSIYYSNEYYSNEYYYSNEGFTPKIRQIYKPYVRNTRIFMENFYNNYNKSITNYLKKYKIM